MVIKPNSLLKPNYTSISNKVALVPSLEESLFEGMLSSISECSYLFTNNKKELYRGILEADGNEFAIQESFTNFLSKVKDIIDKFLDAIRRLFARFITMLYKLVKSDKYILKHKKAFDKFGPDQEFKMKIYTYTTGDETIPRIDTEALVGWSDKTNTHGYNGGETTGDSSDLLTRTKAKYKEINKTTGGESYDSFRGSVIGKDTGIDSSDFASELFQIFRNGETSKEEATIDAGKVSEALVRFQNYDKTIKAVSDKKKEIERKYTDLKKLVKDWSDKLDNHTALDLVFGNDVETANYASSSVDDKKKIDEYAKMFANIMVSRIEEMSKIHAIVFSAKLDAMKESLKQDRTLLYGALSRIQKIKGFRECGDVQDPYYVDSAYDHSEECKSEEDSENIMDEEIPQYVETTDDEDPEDDIDDYDDDEDDDEDDTDDAKEYENDRHANGDHEEY